MLSRIHPLAKLVVCMAWIAVSILVFDAWIQIFIIATAVLSLILLDRRSPLLVLALMVPFALFGFGFLTTSVLFRQESDFALQMARETPLGSEAFSAGIVLFLRAIACGMVSAVFALTTDPGSLVKALMVSWRLPARVGFSLFAALQLVPDLASEAQQIRLARAMKKGRPPRRIPGPLETASLVVPLLAFAIRRATRTAIALEARGLSPDRPRTVIGAPVFRQRDAVFALISMLLVAAALAVTLGAGSG